jgi:hypothetical protein
MNDNELKTALIQRTAGVSADRVKQKVRERILTEETGKDESRPYEGRQVRRRVSVALITALVSLAVVMTAAVTAAPLIRNYLNARSLQEESAGQLTEVPEGWIGVYTLEDLDAVRENLTGYYILMEDLCFAEEDFADGGRFAGGWTPIGTRLEPFYGVFNGNGHTIDGLRICVTPDRYDLPEFETPGYLRSVCAGLFGYAASDPELETEIFGPVYEEEVEMDINGDGILDKVTVTSEPRRTLTHFGDWGQSGTIRNLKLTNGSLRFVYPARIFELGENANGNLYNDRTAFAGPVAGYADYVLGCSVENFTVTLEPAGDAEILENAVPVTVVRRVLALAAGGVAGQAYLVDSCFSGAEISVSVPANMPEDCEVNAGGLCGFATACVTSYFDGSVECAGVTPGLCRIRTDDVPRFLPAAVMDEIVIRLLYVKGRNTDSGYKYYYPDDYVKLTDTARKWGVTAENVYEIEERIRAEHDVTADFFRANKFMCFYRSDDPYYSEISPDAVQDHYTQDAGETRSYILDPSTKPREYGELSRLISAAFPDGDFEDFCRERGVKYGIYYVYDLGKDPECSFEGFDFESVWILDDGTPVLRIFR